MKRRLLWSAVLALCVWGEPTYQKPPGEVLEALNAPPPPVVWASPTGTHALIGELRRYPGIADLAQPFLGLAGLRINPNTNGPQLLTYYHALRLKDLASGRETPVLLPAGARLGVPSWSPDGRHFAVVHTGGSALELLLGEASTGKLRRLGAVALNGVFGSPFSWIDARTLLLNTIPAGRGKPPAAPLAPTGPVVQESHGQSGPVRTYQDMLDSPHEEDLFDFYGAAQLAVADILTSRVTPIGKPGLFSRAAASPDGRYLLVTRIRRPYSYVHSYSSFPRDIEVWDRAGNTVHTVARLPLADNVPIDGVPTGPRNAVWFSTEPATLVWIEALDGGDPRKQVPHRDRILRFRAPFGGEPVEVIRTPQRVSGRVLPIEGTTTAFVSDYDRNRRWIRTLIVDFAQPGKAPRQVWSRASADRYKHPGDPVLGMLPGGGVAVRQHNGRIFLEGLGASPQGDRPFLDAMSLDTFETKRLFESASTAYETFVSLLAPDGSRILTRHESPADPPNYFIRTASGAKTAVTGYRDPVPQLRQIQKQLVRYKRPDGVDLSFTLYLPPGYKPGTRLPTIVYAYPREFNDPGTAGQVTGSTQRFTTIAGISHLFCLLAGYAILDNATMPVVGDPETANNTYIEQISASARAAIDKAVEMGVTDRNRVGVIGHSYGAFMTANLLAHTDLFRAGVARSGAYNRTLTPFGFQNERRTYWQAPEIYLKMSPFQYADRINEPLLLIHGMADNNPGTFPMQSERLYQAVRGNGGTVRLVLLPHESHGYTARESVEHTVWETLTWFDKYVKNAR